LLYLRLREAAQLSLDDVQLVDVALAREERLPVDQFAHDAADGPLVHFEAVHRRAQQQLRRAVPPRGHVVRQRALSP
jgi:hypothetical protein